MFVGLVTGRPLQVKKTGGGIVSGYRQFSDHVDMPTKVGFAGGFLKKEKAENNVSAEKSREFGNAYDLCDRSTRRRIKAGERATFILAVRSWAKCSRPYEYAFSGQGG